MELSKPEQADDLSVAAMAVEEKLTELEKQANT